MISKRTIMHRARRKTRRKLKQRLTAGVQGSSINSSTPSVEKRQMGHDVIGPAPNVER